VHVPGSKIKVIYNGVDLKNFRLTSTNRDIAGLPPPSDNNLLIGMVARLNEAKDHNTLLEAWRLVSQGEIRAKLVLVGDGELRIPLEKNARDLGITESVIFLGNRSDIPAILSRLDLCLLSSQREGFPVTLLEYMAMRRPFIATKVGAIPEFINHGENGYLIPPRNPQALADAISLFCANPKPWAGLTEKARETVEESYDIEKIIRSYEDIYEQVLSN
jgi:glycosyltransferase involved in cell wall biosynthesis